MIELLKKVNVHSSDNGNRFLCSERRDQIIKLLENSDWKKLLMMAFF